MKSKKSYYVALYAIMFATIGVAMALDRLVSLGLGISMALCTLLVTFSFALIRNELSTGFFAGVFFGLASLLKAFIFGEVQFLATALGSDSPLVLLYAVGIYFLPRILVGILAFLTYKGMRLLLDKKYGGSRVKEIICLTVGVFIGLICNTVLFLSALNLAKTMLGVTHSNLLVIIKAVIFTNIIPEYAVSLIFAPTIIVGVRRALRYGLEANFTQEEDKQEV